MTSALGARPVEARPRDGRPADARPADAACAAAAEDPGHRMPLVALLSQVEASFVAEFDRRLAASEFAGLSLAHSRHVLRYIGSDGTRASQIVERCGITKQAVSQHLAHLERAGYVTVGPDPSDQRARIVALTEQGSRAQRHVKRLFGELEREWAREVGADELERVRATLTALLGTRNATC